MSLDQFIRFTTDSVGLERTFRLLHATIQIIVSFAFLLELLVYTLDYSTSRSHSQAATRLILLAVAQRLALGRRFLRLFRFLDSFNAAQKLYASINPPKASNMPKTPAWVQTEQWLDVFGRTFNGMYLLLEASTILNVLDIDGLSIWSPEWERTITVEGQRFWLFALVCGVVSGLLKMLKAMAYTPVPITGDGLSHDETEGETVLEKKPEEKEFDIKREQERLRQIMKSRKRVRALWVREVRAKIHVLGRSMAANALDIVLPGVVVGWVKVGPGVVGVTMFVTTILTGLEVWERCGREVAESR